MLTTTTIMKLPKGAKKIKPTEKKLGTYVEMIYDAKITRHGIDWYRVKDGMGNHGDREDWVADVPGRSISVHDYNWKGVEFGPRFKSFEDALDGGIKAAYRRHAYFTQLKREELEVAESSLAILKVIAEQLDTTVGEPVNGKWC